MTDYERLSEIVRSIKFEYKLTQREVAIKIGLKSATYLSDVLNGRHPVSEQISDSLVKAFPEYSKDWLLTGEGTMLVGESEVKANAKELDPEGLNWISVPVIPFRAMAGSTGWYEDVFADEWKEKRTVIAPLGAKAIDHAIFTVTGDSMEPTLIEGDEILAKHVPFDCYKENRLRIYNYSIWIIATKSEGILIKNITEHDVENHTITCHSFNDKYSDFVLDLSDVKDIYHIVSLTRNY
ncbi:S24 family peptidase [uncultured Porphyromonas sp.]|uniref:XRE family transcriptional regulator n=1 Tax=uncultured Porphyromonas sp. TaxID=159274 RepID=UPI002590E540|nr:S24 family peptidase [uncultured Porphyromonas sp.]